MAQSGYTPIKLYYSATTTNVPLAANLASGELAINTADGKLFYKDSGGVVQVIGTKGGVGSSSTTQVLYNSSGLVAGSANLTFDGTTLTSTGGSLYLNGTNSDTAMTGSYVRFGTNIGLQSNAANSALVAKMFNGSVFVDALTLNTSGYLSVSNTAPTINVNGTSSATFGYTISASGANTAVFQYNATDGSIKIGGIQSYSFPTFWSNNTERMRIDISGNLGIGTTSPGSILDVVGSGNPTLTLRGSAGAYSSILKLQAASGGTSIINATGATSDVLAFQITGTEKMRLDTSGNLGVGVTPSGSYKLQVNGGAYTTAYNVGSGGSNNSAFTGTFDTDGAGTARFYSRGGTTSTVGGFNWHNQSSNGSVDTTAMTLDTSGNLGVGVTPSAWNSAFKAMEIGAKGSSVFASTTANSSGIVLTGNAYYDSASWKYASTAAAANFDTSSGYFRWNIASSGTAGNAITFTQAMTLDSSGNLLVGTTTNSPGARLNLQGAAASVLLHASDGTNGDFYIDFPSSSVARLTAEYGTGGNLVFANGTSKTERARIDDSGNLLVGTTAAGASGGDANYITINKGAGYGANQWVMHVTGTSSGIPYMSFGYAGNSIGSITQSGTTSVLYNTTSDQRLKTNIVDAESASALIDAIQVRQFDWKTDNTHQRYGFIAQELVSVAPEAVHQPADSEDMMAVDYSKLVPMLVKEIQSLRARVAQLESK